MRRGSLPTVWSGAAAGTLVTYGAFAIMAGVGAAAVVAARHGHPAVARRRGLGLQPPLVGEGHT